MARGRSAEKSKGKGGASSKSSSKKQNPKKKRRVSYDADRTYVGSAAAVDDSSDSEGGNFCFCIGGKMRPAGPDNQTSDRTIETSGEISEPNYSSRAGSIQPKVKTRFRPEVDRQLTL